MARSKAAPVTSVEDFDTERLARLGRFVLVAEASDAVDGRGLQQLASPLLAAFLEVDKPPSSDPA